jgi:hypothetical protein
MTIARIRVRIRLLKGEMVEMPVRGNFKGNSKG